MEGQLNQRQMFKAGFLARCIEDGYTTPDQIRERVKEAREKLAIDLWGPIKDVGSAVTGWGIPLALAAPPLAGAGLGYAAAKATDIEDNDVEEERRQELINALRAHTQRLRLRHQRR
jgi:hypothetical protein